MTPALAREAVDAILSMMEWTREISDQFLDGDPEMRRQLVQDKTAARETVNRLNDFIALVKDEPRS